MSDKINSTTLMNAGRRPEWTQKLVNPPVSRGSTVVFDSMADMQHASANCTDHTLYYGRRGTTTHFSLQDAMTELEGAAGCVLYPCGTAAITNSLLAFVEQGDHILVVDGVYEPTRDFCDQILSKMGVETDYFNPQNGGEIAHLIRPNTRVLFLESPCSITMEVLDVPRLTQLAHDNDMIVILDNTWASPLLFRPFDYGVDIAIQAATKYIVGHSDVMLGTATANARCWRQLQKSSYLMGQCTSADDVYMGLRGLRTLAVRLKQHEANTLKVAEWLKAHPLVDRVLHPAFQDCDGHRFFTRDFVGSSGLFSIVLKKSSKKAICAMVDNMSHFRMGFSWGGFESLILPNDNIARIRTVTEYDFSGALLRLHIGLEDVDDLIKDLSEGFFRLEKTLLMNEMTKK